MALTKSIQNTESDWQ